jgi:hypothetical protein
MEKKEKQETTKKKSKTAPAGRAVAWCVAGSANGPGVGLHFKILV